MASQSVLHKLVVALTQLFLPILGLVLHGQTPAGSVGYLPAIDLDSYGHTGVLSSYFSLGD